MRHTRTPALALCGYSGTNWTQPSVCFVGNVFLLHLTRDLKSSRLPPPFLLEAHESQSRQTNESPSQFLVKRASLGGSAGIKWERAGFVGDWPCVEAQKPLRGVIPILFVSCFCQVVIALLSGKLVNA